MFNKITCEIEYTDPNHVSELSDVWILGYTDNKQEGEVIASWRNVMIQVNKIGVEVFRTKPSLVRDLIGFWRPDDIIATIFRSHVDEIIDRRNGDK